jgi:hypothetical protein
VVVGGYSLDGLRLALLRGASFAEIAPSLGVLTAFGVVLLPLSLIFLVRCSQSQVARHTLCLLKVQRTSRRFFRYTDERC